MTGPSDRSLSREHPFAGDVVERDCLRDTGDDAVDRAAWPIAS